MRDILDALGHEKTVGINLDTGNAWLGGGDPHEFVKVFGSRIKHVHWKDMSAEWEVGMSAEKHQNFMKTVAVIGCGKRRDGKVGWAIGQQHGHGYAAANQPVRILGVDLSPENLADFGKLLHLPEDQLFTSTDTLYAAGIPDVVSICTWSGLHAPMALEAMDKGVKGLIIEKPLALNMQEIRAILAKAAKNGANVAVAGFKRDCVFPKAESGSLHR